MSDIPQKLDFTLEFKTIPVQLTDPVTNTVKDYIIKELDGKKRGQYLTGLSKRTSITPGSTTGRIKNFEGLESSLLALCMYEIKEDGGHGPMAQSWFDGLPAQVMQGLYDAARKLSGLDVENEDEDDEDEVGND